MRHHLHLELMSYITGISYCMMGAEAIAHTAHFQRGVQWLSHACMCVPLYRHSDVALLLAFENSL